MFSVADGAGNTPAYVVSEATLSKTISETSEKAVLQALLEASQWHKGAAVGISSTGCKFARQYHANC